MHIVWTLIEMYVLQRAAVDLVTSVVVQMYEGCNCVHVQV